MIDSLQSSSNELGIFYFFCLGSGVGILIYLVMEIMKNRRK